MQVIVIYDERWRCAADTASTLHAAATHAWSNWNSSLAEIWPRSSASRSLVIRRRFWTAYKLCERLPVTRTWTEHHVLMNRCLPSIRLPLTLMTIDFWPGKSVVTLGSRSRNLGHCSVNVLRTQSATFNSLSICLRWISLGVMSHPFILSLWTEDLALWQILSTIDLFLTYRTDSTDSLPT